MNFLSKITATFMGVGYFPVAPGTAATAVGVGIVFLIKDPIVYVAVVFILLVAGILAASVVEKTEQKKDPGIVVIDEVVGLMIGLAGLPLSLPVAICGFFLFRAFDMFKIYPINRFEALPGGFGIMLDDVMAGLYTNIVLSIAVRWAGLN